MTIAFDYFNHSFVLKRFFKEVSRRGLCHPPTSSEL
jgi:hypothetical protein